MHKVNYKDFDLHKLSVRKDENKKISYNALYEDNSSWVLELPSTTITGQLREDDNFFVMDVLCNAEIKKVINNIDNHIIDYVHDESKTIFGKEQNKTKIEDLFKNSLRYGSNLRLRLQEDTVKVYDKNRRPIDLDDNMKIDSILKDSDKIGLLVKLENIRIGTGIIKVNWYVHQLKLSKVITDCQISDDEEDEAEDNDSELEDY